MIFEVENYIFIKKKKQISFGYKSWRKHSLFIYINYEDGMNLVSLALEIFYCNG